VLAVEVAVEQPQQTQPRHQVQAARAASGQRVELQQQAVVAQQELAVQLPQQDQRDSLAAPQVTLDQAVVAVAVAIIPQATTQDQTVVLVVHRAVAEVAAALVQVPAQAALEALALVAKQSS
jgi:hypothetical protein